MKKQNKLTEQIVLFSKIKKSILKLTRVRKFKSALLVCNVIEENEFLKKLNIEKK